MPPKEPSLDRRLRLRDLKLLQEIARLGSMAKAARELGITQPAVSKALSDLETLLGVRLLDRTTGGVTPTDYGTALLRHAAVMFDALRQANLDLAHLADPSVGALRIACPEFIAAGILPVALEHFAKRFPRVVIDVVQAENIAPEFRLLRDRQVDLMIGRVPSCSGAHEEDVAIEFLFSERMHVVTGPTSRWVKKRTLTLADIASERWTLPPADSVAGGLAREAFAAEGLSEPCATIVSFSLHLRKAAAASGEFLTVLHDSVLQLSRERSALRILPIVLKIKVQPVAIITLKRRTLLPAAQPFMACLRAAAARLKQNPRG
ncbi:MAG TPA: LysR family transcriptional regulator [Stellaceae bacterium]|jgi:molybdate transport repressor ModE-like protein|nr:LysR family transcriptional regulator [Stellaceae bacterium]